jgi:hypothetical protein
MESLIDAIKKRAWRSAWLALQEALIAVLVWLVNTITGVFKLMVFLYLCGFAVGFGGWAGLNSAIEFEVFLRALWPVG